MNILVGCDPELFVKKNGTFVSAHGLIPGDKLNPMKVPNGAVQVDGMALEFNIDPASSEEQFLFNVKDVLNTMKNMVPDMEVVASPVAHFDKKYFDTQPAESKVLGCDPDYDAWQMRTNEKPDCNIPMRTASGHVHIGWTENQIIEDHGHFVTCAEVVRELDYYLGLASLQFDEDQERRSMYGKGGCFRPKSYGVEYRTLSNAWLASDDLIKWVFRTTETCIKNFFSGKRLQDKYGDISEIINTNNKEEAMKIIQAENLEVCYA
jgi:hypothetical protein